VSDEYHHFFWLALSRADLHCIANFFDLIALTQGSCASSSQSFLSLPASLPAHVLGYVGPGEWAYLGAVSKSCQAAYLDGLATADKTALSASHRATTYAAAVASVSRMQEAVVGGLLAHAENDLDAARLIALQAGKLADRDTLLWLKANCACLWREALCHDAIIHGRLDLLHWLHDEQQCPWSFTADCLAARHNQLAVLQYIHSKRDGGVPVYDVDEIKLTFSLNAVESDSPELLQWCCTWLLLCKERDNMAHLYDEAVRLRKFEAAGWLLKHAFQTALDSVFTQADALVQQAQQLPSTMQQQFAPPMRSVRELQDQVLRLQEWFSPF
jgi:hypothetical protein